MITKYKLWTTMSYYIYRNSKDDFLKEKLFFRSGEAACARFVRQLKVGLVPLLHVAPGDLDLALQALSWGQKAATRNPRKNSSSGRTNVGMNFCVGSGRQEMIARRLRLYRRETNLPST